MARLGRVSVGGGTVEVLPLTPRILSFPDLRTASGTAQALAVADQAVQVPLRAAPGAVLVAGCVAAWGP